MQAEICYFAHPDMPAYAPQGRLQDFSKGDDFCKGGVTIHCLITKICELGAFFLYFPFVLVQNESEMSVGITGGSHDSITIQNAPSTLL